MSVTAFGYCFARWFLRALGSIAHAVAPRDEKTSGGNQGSCLMLCAHPSHVATHWRAAAADGGGPRALAAVRGAAVVKLQIRLQFSSLRVIVPEK
jgi:hypothetical protein